MTAYEMRISDWSSDVCFSDLGEKSSDEIWFDIAEKTGNTEFIGYSSTDGEGEVVSIVKDGVNFDSAAAGETVLIVTNQTPFCGESGGQMGDAGTISSQSGLVADVEDTAKPLGRPQVRMSVG